MAGHGFFEFPLFLQGNPQAVVDLGTIGCQSQHLLEMCGRFRRLALLERRASQCSMPPHESQAGGERLAQSWPVRRLASLEPATQGRDENALGEIGFDAQSVVQGGHRLGRPPQLAQGIAEVALSDHEIRLKANSLLKTGDRLRQLPLIDENIAQVVVGSGKPGL